MANRIISMVFLLFFGVSSALFFGVALGIWMLTVMFDRRLVALHMFTSLWAVLYLWVMPGWSVTVHGRNKIKRKTVYMLVSNHQSQLDILVAFKLFIPFKWISKAEVFTIPFIGWNMALNRYIKLKRGDKRSIQKMLEMCENSISKGNSLYFFPEGTRSRTNTIKPFKPGAFTLAKKMKLPILPVAIRGTRNALPKYSLKFQGSHHMTVRVLDEIPYSSFAHLSAEKIGEMVRSRIDEQVNNP
jgi:1-acyl-sn-glycerol-3-phosphate acyltransferase